LGKELGREGFRVFNKFRHHTLYGVTNRVTEVTKRVAGEESLTFGGMGPNYGLTLSPFSFFGVVPFDPTGDIFVHFGFAGKSIC